MFISGNCRAFDTYLEGKIDSFLIESHQGVDVDAGLLVSMLSTQSQGVLQVVAYRIFILQNSQEIMLRVSFFITLTVEKREVKFV